MGGGYIYNAIGQWWQLFVSMESLGTVLFADPDYVKGLSSAIVCLHGHILASMILYLSYLFISRFFGGIWRIPPRM